MNYVEIKFADGTIARWSVVDDGTEAIDKIENAIFTFAGQPDTIIT